MERFHEGRALMVRDRPQMYLESNRKPGSKSRSVGLPSYFYFLFGLWGPRNAIFVFFGQCGPLSVRSVKVVTALCCLIALNFLVFRQWESAHIHRRYRNSNVAIFHFLGFFGLHSFSFALDVPSSSTYHCDIN